MFGHRQLGFGRADRRHGAGWRLRAPCLRALDGVALDFLVDLDGHVRFLACCVGADGRSGRRARCMTGPATLPRTGEGLRCFALSGQLVFSPARVWLPCARPSVAHSCGGRLLRGLLGRAFLRRLLGRFLARLSSARPCWSPSSRPSCAAFLAAAFFATFLAALLGGGLLLRRGLLGAAFFLAGFFLPMPTLALTAFGIAAAGGLLGAGFDRAWHGLAGARLLGGLGLLGHLALAVRRSASDFFFTALTHRRWPCWRSRRRFSCGLVAERCPSRLDMACCVTPFPRCS